MYAAGEGSSGRAVQPLGSAASKPPVQWQPAGSTTAAPPGPSQARVWLHIDDQGKASYVQVEKQSLVQTLGIPYRDLRILDPLVPMPYPTAIFIREKALVINLETIKMIICKDQVFLLSVVDMNQPDKPARPSMEHHYVADLCRRLKSAAPLRRETANVNIDTDLPYELRALEAALAEVNKVLEHEVTTLEQDAWAALDHLTKQVSRAALEQVRRVKTRLNRLTARIGKLREELEDLMDDDEDMADMYLGRRAELEAAETLRERERVAAMQAEERAAAMQAEYERGDLGGVDFYTDTLADRGHELHMARSDHDDAGSTDTPDPDASFLGDAEAAASEPGGPGADQPQEAEASPAGPQADAELKEGVAGEGEAGEAVPSSGRSAGQGPLPPLGLPPPLAGGGSSKSSAKAKISWPLGSVGAKPSAAKSETAKTAAPKKHHKVPHKVVNTFKQGMQMSHQKSKSSIAPVSAEAHMEEPGMEPSKSPVPEPTVLRWMPSAQGAIWGGVDPHDIEGVEALLEAYFMQVDFSMSRLVILKERIDDTEDLINIELDSRRNELVALEVILTTLTLILAIISAVGGIFGMNLKSGIEEDEWAFYIVTIVSIVAAIVAFLAIIVYCRQKRLMFMGVPSKVA